MVLPLTVFGFMTFGFACVELEMCRILIMRSLEEKGYGE
jgi:hypothetical protein